MSKHTPGPWAVNLYITSGNQSLGFHITGPRDGSDMTKPEDLQGCECPICTNIAALRERLEEKP